MGGRPLTMDPEEGAGYHDVVGASAQLESLLPFQLADVAVPAPIVAVPLFGAIELADELALLLADEPIAKDALADEPAQHSATS
eukprot:m.774645 g.774645  ORF g.774645 m.774645 type:complete len:84 (+) comp59107_c0_seq12:2150-2401(+)